MQTSKISVVLCAYLACAPFTLRATDTPAQAAARVQVEAKLRELDGPAAAATVPAVVVAPSHAVAAESAMKPIESAQVGATASDKAAADLKEQENLRATDTSAQAAARAQVEKKLKELDGQAAATTEPAMKPIKHKATASEVTAAKAQAKADKAAANLKSRQDAERMAAQKQAAKASAAAAKAKASAAKTKPEVSAVDAGKLIGLQPLAAPALPIDSSKTARLQVLLAKYQADQISPEEYHKQRAAILAAP